MPRARGMVFDLQGTLLSVATNPPAGARRLMELTRRPHAITAEQYEAKMTALMEEVDRRRNQSLIEFPAVMFHRLLFEHFNLTSTVPFTQLMLEFWKASRTLAPTPGVKQVLTDLASLRIPMGVMTNTVFGPEPIRYELARHDLIGHFKFVIISSEYGLRKPHGELFALAARKMNLEPGQIWFIGDRWDYDVQGSRTAGMTPVWYRGEGAEGKGGGGDDVAEIRQWSELLGLLRKAR